MKTVRDVIAHLLTYNEPELNEAAAVLSHSLFSKELIDDGTLVHVATVGRDFPDKTHAYVMIAKGVELTDYIDKALFAHKN